MRILEDTQGGLRVVPEDEIRLLGKLCDSDISLERTGYQLQGQLMEVVRVDCGELPESSETSPRRLCLFLSIHCRQA